MICLNKIKKGEKIMSNKKKVLLFLGAVMLVAFGNYTRFVKNSNGKTTVEEKKSEKATSSKGGTSKEGKSSEKATSSAGNNANQNAKNTEVMAEVKSVPKSQLQPVSAEQTQNKSNTDTKQNIVAETKNSERATSSTGNDSKKKENPENPKQQPEKPAHKQKDAKKLKIKKNKNVENKYKLDKPKSDKKKTTSSSEKN